MLWIGPVSYDASAKLYLQQSGHYLDNPPPGCLFAIGVREMKPVLFDDLPVPCGPLLGLCLVGRPVARNLPQDGSVGEVTRMVLDAGLPYGMASKVLVEAGSIGKKKGMHSLISYHDRTKHTGCIYRKAGFRKDGVTTPGKVGWGSRNRPKSQKVGHTSKRRWKLELV